MRKIKAQKKTLNKSVKKLQKEKEQLLKIKKTKSAAPSRKNKEIRHKPSIKQSLGDLGIKRVVIPLDTSIYPLDAIYSTSYVFLDRAYVYLEKGSNGKIEVSLMSKGRNVKDEDLIKLAGEFANELVGQSIRATLDESGKKIREYVVLKSQYGQTGGGMSLEGLLDQTLKEALEEDPLEIAVPWEEKYGKKEGTKEEK